MTIAIVPLRSLRDGKRRLEPVASLDERRWLVERMLERTIGALRRSDAVEQIALVSPDAGARALGERLGATGLAQASQGLNEGLAEGRAAVMQRWPGRPLLIVLPDLPYVEPGDIAGVARLGAEGTVVIAPDRHYQGTNLMWLPPDTPLPFRYGAGSFARHRAAAAELGLGVRCYHSAGTAFDLDTADDLEQVGRRVELLPPAHASWRYGEQVPPRCGG